METKLEIIHFDEEFAKLDPKDTETIKQLEGKIELSIKKFMENMYKSLVEQGCSLQPFHFSSIYPHTQHIKIKSAITRHHTIEFLFHPNKKIYIELFFADSPNSHGATTTLYLSHYYSYYGPWLEKDIDHEVVSRAYRINFRENATTFSEEEIEALANWLKQGDKPWY